MGRCMAGSDTQLQAAWDASCRRAWGSVMGHVIQQQDSMRCRCRAGCDADAGLEASWPRDSMEWTAMGGHATQL